VCLMHPPPDCSAPLAHRAVGIACRTCSHEIPYTALRTALAGLVLMRYHTQPYAPPVCSSRAQNSNCQSNCRDTIHRTRHLALVAPVPTYLWRLDGARARFLAAAFTGGLDVETLFASWMQRNRGSWMHLNSHCIRKGINTHARSSVSDGHH
jgi:hypothetical protein